LRDTELGRAYGRWEGKNEKSIWHEAGTPLFFVSVASKGLNLGVSLLFATLAGWFISVADKGLRGVARLKVKS
jgi:hypothetical protein